MIITDYLKIFAEKTPNKIAVHQLEDITYKELDKRVLDLFLISQCLKNLLHSEKISWILI